jgi:hypothetical protein
MADVTNHAIASARIATFSMDLLPFCGMLAVKHK